LKLLRRGAIALSLANLCYLQAWWQLLAYKKADTFKMAVPPDAAQYLALLAMVFFQALLFFLAASLAARKKGRFAALGRTVFFLVLLIPLDNTKQLVFQLCRVFRHDFLRNTAPNLLFIVPVIVVAILINYNRSVWESRMVRAASVILLLCFPLVGLVIAGVAYKIATYDARPFRNGPTAALLPVPAGQPRVIVALYDEWDYRLSFEGRKPGVNLPNIDRLRQESLFGTNVHSTMRDTILSVPSLLTGEEVADLRYEDASKANVRFAGQTTWVDFGQFPNLFTKARAAGVNAAVIGWYIPYCRLFSKDLVYCDWTPVATRYNTQGGSFAEDLLNEPRSMVELNMDTELEVKILSPFGQPLETQRRAKTYQKEQRELLEKAVDPQVGLLYVHFGAPHSPYFYNSRTGQFDLNTMSASGYLQNLALVDRSVSELRQRLEAAGLWDTTTVLLIADHSYRTSRRLDGKTDPRVPFILKMAGSREGVTLNFPFNSLLTQQLLLGILEKRISTTQEAAQWIGSQAEKQSPSLRTRTFKYN
jgi:hypothetical protein